MKLSLFGSNGKGLSQGDIDAITQYNNQLKQGVTSQTAWNRTMLQASPAAQHMVSSANGAAVAVEGLGTQAELTRWQMLKLRATSIALNVVFSVISMIVVQSVVKAFTYLYNIQDKLAEKTKELTSSLKSQTDEYNNLKSELDEVNKKLKDNESRYSELIEKQKESGLTTEESGELEELQRITGELTNQKNILEENIRLKKESAASTAQELANTLLKQEDVKSFMDGAGGKIKSFFNVLQESSVKMIPGFGKLYTMVDTIVSLFNIKIPKDSWLNKIANIFDGTAIISWLTGTDIEEDSYDEAVSKYEDLQKKMKAIRDKYDKNGDGIIDSDSSMSSEDSETYKKYYDESVEVANNLKTEYQELDDAIKAIEADPNLTQVNKEELERLRAARDIIAEILGYNNEGKTGDGIISDEDVKNVDKMTVSLSDLEGVSDKIKIVGDAFKEFSDNGYLSVKTLGELKTVTGLSDEEFEKYKNTLLSAKTGSSEFNRIMSEMTFKILDNTFKTKGLTDVTEDEIATVLRENNITNASVIAKQYKAKATLEAKLAEADYSKGVNAVVSSLEVEAEALGLTQQEVIDLASAYAKAQASMNEIVADSVHDRLGILSDELEGIKSLADAYALLSKDGTVRYTPDGYGKDSELVGSELSRLSDEEYTAYLADRERILAYGRLQDKIAELKDYKIDIPDYSVDSSSSSSKNEPLDNYLKYAENLYKVHQDEAKYINDLQWAYNNLTKDEDERLKVTEKINEAYRDMADNRIKDLEHQIKMTKNLKGENADVIAQLNEIQRVAHEEAERLRSMDYDDNSNEIQELQKQWWDAEKEKLDWRLNLSKDWIDERNRLGDWKLFNDNEVDAWERVIKWLKEEYPHAIDEIKEAEESLFEARKEQMDKLSDFGSSYLDSQKTLLQTYYETTNAIEEAYHEINKELETSKTMYEWLDEDTRKLLFNQEDYNALSRELNEIQSEAIQLKADYEDALNNSTLDTIEEITSNYEMQYDMLMKSYEIAKADLEIAKKKAKLNNVLNERNVRMFINGQWQWVANTQDVIDAKAELADAEYARRMAKAGLTQQESINNLTEQQNHLGTVISQFESGVIDLDTATSNIVEMFDKLPTAMQEAFRKMQVSVLSSSSGGSSSFGGVSYDKNFNYAAAMSSLTPGSATWNALNKQRNAKIAGEKLDYKPFATGTKHTPSGNLLMGEEEPEIFIDKNGHLIPINQPTLGNFGAGGVVFNQDQMAGVRELWDLSNIITPSASLVNNARTPSESFVFSGDINVYNPTDAQDVADNVVAHIVQGLKLQRKSR